MLNQNLVTYVREGKWLVDPNLPESDKQQQGANKLIEICNRIFEVYKKDGGNSYKDARDYVVAMLGEARYPKCGIPAYITNEMFTNSLQHTVERQAKEIKELQNRVQSLEDRIQFIMENISKDKKSNNSDSDSIDSNDSNVLF